MNYLLQESLNLAIRWFHVFAGILWIGQTWYFTWLDRRLSDPDEKGEVWMVHSGGFYVVKKQSSPEGTRSLHWFRWEAALTWISGLLLLILVYYMGGVLIDPEESKVSFAVAATIGLALLPAGWLIYDGLWISPLGRHPWLGSVISFLLIVATAYGLTRILSGRAAYLHVGAILGTIMAANVWMRILPAQRKLIAAAREGKEPDQALAASAKDRSKHNTFMVVPVVFIMISNHFPTATYGRDLNWLILGGLVLLGWGAAAILRRH
ncbi:MAG TPA: urate hydroxylase PuuD [Thermoanaerobaculia bacterium]|nr:urate hydroxylase PuuD [Thermoanaerobaculia bacterium]